MLRLVFQLAPACVGALQLYANTSSEYTYYFSPFFPEGPKPNVTAPAIIIPDLFDESWQHNDPLLSGKIGVWIGYDPARTFREDFVHRAAYVGLVGLVGWTSWVPEHFFETDMSNRNLLTIPYVTVHKDDLIPIQAVVGAGGAEIALLEDSPNEWMILFESLEFFLLWRVGLGLSSAFLALLSIQKLYLWYSNYRATKFVSQIAVLCLVVELLCNIERATFFYFSGTRQVGWKFTRISFSLSFPLTYLTTALTVAYIHDVLTSTSPIGTMLARTKKPLLCLTIFYLVTDVPISIISAFRISAGLILATISTLAITVGLTITAGLQLYLVIRLRRYQKKSFKPVAANGPPTPDRLAILLDRVPITADTLQTFIIICIVDTQGLTALGVGATQCLLPVLHYSCFHFHADSPLHRPKRVYRDSRNDFAGADDDFVSAHRCLWENANSAKGEVGERARALFATVTKQRQPRFPPTGKNQTEPER